MSGSNGKLEKLSELTKDFWIDPKVKVMTNPSPIEFLRNSFSTYTPSILKGLMNEWNCYQKWDIDYLNKIIHDKDIKVNFTPDGRADSIIMVPDTKPANGNLQGNNEIFVYPLEQKLKFAAFRDMLLHPHESDAVPYLSEQNDNLREEFPELMNDVPSHFSLASTCFGDKSNNTFNESSSKHIPEAVNLWIGDERSQSSLHKDHFENFYAVIYGVKVFTLFPPTDTAYLPEIEFKTSIYKLKSNLICSIEKTSNRIQKNDLHLSPEGCPSETLSWIPLNPHTDRNELIRKYPKYQFASPVVCEVKAGEVLYIPSMWYHHVTQSCLTIAVNYWYDQRFDFRYVFYQTIRDSLANEAIDNEK